MARDSSPIILSISTSGEGKNSYSAILNRVEKMVESSRVQGVPAENTARGILHVVLLDLGIKIED